MYQRDDDKPETIRKRLGAERAIIAYRRTEDEMPARRAELHHAKAEGVEVLPLVSPLEFVAGEDGAVCAVRVQKMELGEPDADGRRRPVAIEGAIEDIPCDVAISAIGTNANPFAKMIGDIKLNKWGYIEADEEGRTSDPRIWAGGDIVGACRLHPFALWDAGFDFYAPQTFESDDGRRILIGWGCSASAWKTCGRRARTCPRR